VKAPVQLRRLFVRNIRSYPEADLTLGPGTTLITGDVGSGKTSLLYAIEMALFGFAEVEPAYLVRHQAPSSEVRLTLEDAGHRYEFGRRFRRRMRKGRDIFELESAAYAVDGAAAGYSVTEIRERAISLLGFPDNPNPRAHSDLWRWGIYVPQERMRDVLSQDPEERLQTVRKALGLERYRTAADNLALLAAEIRRIAERSDAEARGSEHLLERLPGWRSELDRHTTAVAQASDDLARARAATAAAHATYEELSARRHAIERIRADRDLWQQRRAEEVAKLRDATGRVEALQQEQAHLQDEERAASQAASGLPKAESALAALESELAEARTERELRATALERMAALDARIVAAREAARRADEQCAKAEADQASLTEELQRARAEGPRAEPTPPTRRTIETIDQLLRSTEERVATGLQAVAVATQEVHEIDELLADGVCPRCHQAVPPEQFGAHRAEAQRSLVLQSEGLQAAQAELLALRDERASRERFERVVLRWTERERARAAAAEQLERAAQRRREADDRRRDALEQTRALTEEQARHQPAADAARAAGQRLAALETERERHVRAVADLRSSAEASRLAATKLAQLIRETTSAEQLVAARRSELATIDTHLQKALDALAEGPSILEGADRARATWEAAQTEEQRLAREVSRADALAETLRGQIEDADRRLAARSELLTAAAEERELAGWLGQPFRDAILQLERRLLARAQQEFERSLARSFAILIEDPALTARCDPSFSPSVEINGEWTPAEALSGGERTALALAFRLALGTVVRSAGRLRLETLLLDEPTDGFSPEQVTRMGELLESLGIPQVILVSHEAQLAGIADRVLRVEKRDGRSVVLAPEGPRSSDTPASAPSAMLPAAASRARRVRTPRLDSPAAGSESS
jgi:exonuclease SbcC